MWELTGVDRAASMFQGDLGIAVLSAYFTVLVILSFYGLHRYQLVYLYFKHGRRRPQPSQALSQLPRITVQLPIFNEFYVVNRLIDAVCALDYPKDRLEIQILDDSTDETSDLARRCVASYAQEGFDIHHLHRPARLGFKAGALQRGLEAATGQLIAIFDADFVPKPETLRRVVDFFSDPGIGMVQMRWGHINQDYSLLTRLQSILLDGHFVIESATRYRSGRFFNFNGTAGIWRREAIEDSGGWEHDTLTEDLDLSYRAQLNGWRFVFISDFQVPAEIPVDMNSFKSQQYRWAKGSIQTARKLLPRVLRADLPWPVKLEAFYHLTANVSYPLMVLLGLLLFPALLIRLQHDWLSLLLLDVPLFAAATLSVSSFYLVSQREIRPDWLSQLKYLPLVLSTGIGLSVNNSRAVLEGCFGRNSDFVRTPKFCIQNPSDVWRGRRYRALSGWTFWVEILLGLLYSATILYSLQAGHYHCLPFLLLFLIGYFYTGLSSLIHAAQRGVEADQLASIRAR